MNTAYTPYRATQRVEIRRLVLALVVGLLALGCGEESDLSDEEPDLSNDQHSQICEQIDASIGLHDGYDVLFAGRSGTIGGRENNPSLLLPTEVTP